MSSGYLSEDTIAAIATALGGPVAILRLSGPRAFEILEAVSGGGRPPEPRVLTRALLRSVSGATLDDALVVRFVAPQSYSGEDVVELHVHGGAFVASRVLEELIALGARQALAGEFSFRAVRNGKFSISQAQAVSDLIGATNETAVQLALEKMSGAQNRIITALAEDLRKLTTLSEAGIDFADQDLEEVSLPRLKKNLAKILDFLSALKNTYQRGARIQEGMPVALLGRPNAGKSSFFNALLGEDRSIVSEIPGTTRDVVGEKITLRAKDANVTFRLEDTAGLRDGADIVEQMGIERTRQAARRAELALFLVDASAPLEPALEEWRQLSQDGIAAKSLGVLTKIDLLTPEALAGRKAEFAQFGISTWFETSAMSGCGIHEVAVALVTRAESLVRREPGEILLTRLDQLRAVEAAIVDLERAQNAPEIDLFASDLRQALHSLGPLIGETLPDDILGRIFSEFCIGK